MIPERIPNIFVNRFGTYFVLCIVTFHCAVSLCQSSDPVSLQSRPHAEQKAGEADIALSDTERAAAAAAAFSAGNTAFNNEDYLEASTQYRRAYTLRPNWKLQYNIAQCEALLKRHGQALIAFEKYLSEGGDDITSERRQEVSAEVERLRTLVGYLEIVAAAGESISVDGIHQGISPLAGSIPVAVAVNHKIQVGTSAPRTVIVHGGQTVKVDFSQVEQPHANPADATAAATVDNSDNSDNTVPSLLPQKSTDNVSIKTNNLPTPSQMHPAQKTGILLLATGGTAIVTGLITGAIALKKNQYLKEQCDLPTCSAEYRGDLDTRDHLVTATNVLLATGVALAATGTVLLIYRKKKLENQTQRIATFAGKNFVWLHAAWRF